MVAGGRLGWLDREILRGDVRCDAGNERRTGRVWLGTDAPCGVFWCWYAGVYRRVCGRGREVDKYRTSFRLRFVFRHRIVLLRLHFVVRSLVLILVLRYLFVHCCYPALFTSIHRHASHPPRGSPISSYFANMLSFKKPQLDPEINSFEAPPTLETHPAMRHSQKKSNLITSVNTGLTVLALLSAMTIVGTSADTIQVYNTTAVGEGRFLSMWPNEFDLRPTVALVVCGAIILVGSVLSLVVGKVNLVRSPSSPLPSFPAWNSC